MNYERIYAELVEHGRRNNKNVSISYERHHIIPKCIGGLDDKDNIVDLTPREHFIAHLLLTKTKPCGPIWYAFILMSKLHGKFASKLYETARKESRKYISSVLTGREITPEWRKKISDALKGRVLSKEHRDNIRSYIRSMPQSHKDAISKGQIGRLHSAEHKRKIGIGNKGKFRSKEFKKRISENLKAKISSGEFIPNIAGLKRGHEPKAYDASLAASMILNGSTNKEVAKALNVSIPTHIKNFKEKYKQTPNEYKKSHEQNLHN